MEDLARGVTVNAIIAALTAVTVLVAVPLPGRLLASSTASSPVDHRAAFPGIGVLVVVSAVLLLLIIVVGAGIMFFDLSGRREEEAEWLQARIARRLERDAGADAASILPVVCVAGSTHAPLVVEVHGRVPSDAAHRAVLESIADEIERSRPGLRVERVEVNDRLHEAQTLAA